MPLLMNPHLNIMSYIVKNEKSSETCFDVSLSLHCTDSAVFNSTFKYRRPKMDMKSAGLWKWPSLRTLRPFLRVTLVFSAAHISDSGLATRGKRGAGRFMHRSRALEGAVSTDADHEIFVRRASDVWELSGGGSLKSREVVFQVMERLPDCYREDLGKGWC